MSQLFLQTEYKSEFRSCETLEIVWRMKMNSGCFWLCCLSSRAASWALTLICFAVKSFILEEFSGKQKHPEVFLWILRFGPLKPAGARVSALGVWMFVCTIHILTSLKTSFFSFTAQISSEAVRKRAERLRFTQFVSVASKDVVWRSICVFVSLLLCRPASH